MNQKTVKLVSKLFVIFTLILTMTACSGPGSDRYQKYMKIVENDAKVFDLVANIQPDSVVMQDDGTMIFNSVTDEGIVIPFVASNVTYDNGTLIVSPRGRVDALKSVGQIYGYHALVSEPGSENNILEFYGGYTFSEVTEVDSIDKLTESTRHSKHASEYDEKNGFVELFDFLPNFIGFGADRVLCEDPTIILDDFTITSLKVYYNTDTYTTGIKLLTVDETFFTAYLEGSIYDPSQEGKFDAQSEVYDFYLIAVPDVYAKGEEVDMEHLLSLGNYSAIYGINGNTMQVGDLKDAQGNVLDKSNAKVEQGMTLDINFGETTHLLSLPVVSAYKGASTLYELIPNATSKAEGDLNVLVVPINWSDEEATDEKLQVMKEMVGRVSENGTITDYTDDTESLSSYFDKASYGELNITSYFTDWYQSEYPFTEMKHSHIGTELGSLAYMSGKEYDSESKVKTYASEIISWVNETQNIDKEVFDLDDNNLYDAVIFLNAGNMPIEEGYMPMSFAGGNQHIETYTGAGLSDGTQLAANTYSSIHVNLNANTLIHEFGHQLGLVDYYDVSYSGYGCDAVGGYDMQSFNVGDWNPYSKYAVGWTTPIVVEDLAIGESVDIEIGSFTTTGDTIVIPAAGTDFDGPFNEYIMVDLLTDEGLSTYWVDKSALGINEGEYGVRMYHVNSVMERRDLEEDGKVYPIGTIHYANAYNDKGQYLVEMIQSGGENSFTNPNGETRLFNASDLFQENDVFTAQEYDEFLLDGKMDNGDEFGYSVKVVSIDKVNGEYKAVIRVTRE